MQSFTVCFLLPLIFTVHAEVVQQFENKCDQFFYNGKEPQVQRCKYDVRICQTFGDEPRFATLYNTASRIPVYSAYIYEYKEGKCERERVWSIEPQLVDQNWDKNMASEGDLPKDDKMGDKQALNSDYIGLEKALGYNRGHLNPNQHHTGDGCKATFTLTNIVPQNAKLNGGFWSNYETKLRTTFKDCKTAYVVVGAITSAGNWVKNRVNIPDYLWHAFYCVDNNDKPYKSGAAAVRNENTDVVECSINSLNEFFKKVGSRVQQVFSDKCNAPTSTGLISWFIEKVKSRFHRPSLNNCDAPTSIGDGDCASIVP